MLALKASFPALIWRYCQLVTVVTRHSSICSLISQGSWHHCGLTSHRATSAVACVHVAHCSTGIHHAEALHGRTYRAVWTTLFAIGGTTPYRTAEEQRASAHRQCARGTASTTRLGGHWLVSLLQEKSLAIVLHTFMGTTARELGQIMLKDWACKHGHNREVDYYCAHACMPGLLIKDEYLPTSSTLCYSVYERMWCTGSICLLW